MEKIIDKPRHSFNTYLYSCSMMFERAAYYGIRSVLILNLVMGDFEMGDENALSIYGWFTFSIMFAKIIGGVIGDFLIGHKKSMIIGGYIQAVGMFLLCIPNLYTVYFSLFLIVLGGGLYGSNILASYGKLYLKKTKLLDAAYMLLFFFVNLGAFFGTLACGYIGESSSFKYGFVLAGVFMVLSATTLLISQSNKSTEPEISEAPETKRVIPDKSYNLITILFFVIISLYYLGVNYTNVEIVYFEHRDVIGQHLFPIDTIISSFFAILAFIIWSFYYYNQLTKLLIAIFASILSIGVFFIQPQPSAFIIIFSMICLGIAEAHTSPLVHSVIVKRINPKYLATAFGLAFIPLGGFVQLFTYFFNPYADKMMNTLFLGIGLLLLSAIILLVFRIKGKRV